MRNLPQDRTRPMRDDERQMLAAAARRLDELAGFDRTLVYALALKAELSQCGPMVTEAEAQALARLVRRHPRIKASCSALEPPGTRLVRDHATGRPF
jgi:hypothetical protein